jgi:hypothetical protein
MLLEELKTKTQKEWQDYLWFQEALIQPELFESEISHFGDLTLPETWVQALCRFRAYNCQFGLIDAHRLITHDFNFTPDRWDYEFRFQILEEFCQLPDGLDLIRMGLEQYGEGAGI